MEHLLQGLLHLTENDRNVLTRMSQCLPLLADVARADAFILAVNQTGTGALVVADANPNTVPPLYPDSLIGRNVSWADEPAVRKAITRGSPVQRVNRVLVYGHPTVQDVYPIWNEQRVIGALSIEVGLLEAERQRRKSNVFRDAVAQLRDMVLRGQLDGSTSITPLGEHDGPIVIDQSGEILYISSIAENLFRKLEYTHSLLHTNVSELRTDESVFFSATETGACVEKTVQDKQLTLVKKAIPLVAGRRDGWMSHVPRRHREIDGVFLVLHDITDEREKEQELRIKSAMIKEIHHRVKNNLQTIAALLRMQSRRTESADVADILRETITRILSIAVVHEFLATDESPIVNITEVSQRIVTEVARSILDPEKRIRVTLEGRDIYLPSQQATSCALVINELLQNAVEHGYVALSEGTITVSLAEDGDRCTLTITDDGQGLRSDFALGKESSLGLQIIQTLVKEDLKGTFELKNVPGSGARAVVSFPTQLAAQRKPAAQVSGLDAAVKTDGVAVRVA